MEWMNLAML
ncbi:uncharacterized protein ACO6RY_16861 [Pungitius sinensis]